MILHQGPILPTLLYISYLLFSGIENTSSQMEKKSEENLLSNIESNAEPEKDDLGAEEKSRNTMEDLNMLAKLFPKIDRTTLIDNLLACNGNTVEAIHKLLSVTKPAEPSREYSEPEEKKKTPTPPPPPPSQANFNTQECSLPKIGENTNILS